MVFPKWSMEPSWLVVVAQWAPRYIAPILRLKGAGKTIANVYASGSLALNLQVKRVRAWASGATAKSKRVGEPVRAMPRDAFVYFDNDAKVCAPLDAQSQMKMAAKLRS
jgi:uncharacterized protein YecE (DUF72 family)